MANDVFDVATDLSIRYFNQTLSAYVDVVADSFEVDIDRGINIEQGVFASVSVGVATVKLVKKNLTDFLGTPGYKAGDLFDIRYRPTPDTAPLLYNTIYAGYIQNVSMNYINESQTLEITIVANDVMRYYMNQVLPSFSTTGTVANRSFRNCLIQLTSALSTASTYSPSGVSLTAAVTGAGSATTQIAYTWVNEPAGSILQRFVDAELGWVWGSKTVANDVRYLTRGEIDTKKLAIFTPGVATASNVHYRDFMNNGNFEVNTSNWVALTGSTTLSRVTSTFYTGIASLRVASSATTITAYQFSTSGGMIAEYNRKYKASIWAKGEVNTPSARITVLYKNSGGATLASFTSELFALNTTDWTEMSLTSVAPLNTAFIEMRVIANKTSAAIASVFADNAKMQDLTIIPDTHFCLDNINLNYDSDNLVNRAVVVDSLTGARTVASNATSIAANGIRADEFTVNLDNAGTSTYATLASRIANAATVKQVYGVTVPVIRDDGRAGTIANYDIGDQLQVEFAQDPLSALQVVSMVSRINHVITPQHWEMNIGLWRGI
jgi:hypothetical protein